MITELSRRAFVKGGLGLAASTVALAHVETAAALVRQAIGVGPALTRSTFTPVLGSSVKMTDGVASAQLRLVKIRDLTPARRPNDPHAFSLLFQAPTATRLPQKTYAFSAPKLAKVSLFAVPVGAAAAGRFYEVIVNT